MRTQNMLDITPLLLLAKECERGLMVFGPCSFGRSHPAAVAESDPVKVKDGAGS